MNASVCLEEDQADQIESWLDELIAPCSAARELMLAQHLANALEGFMGIERDLLMPRLLGEAQRLKSRASFLD